MKSRRRETYQPITKGTVMTNISRPAVFQGLPLDGATGKYAVYANNDKAIVVDGTTGKAVKRFSGETAWSDGERYAGDLHLGESRR